MTLPDSHIRVAGENLVLDRSGAVWWPAHRALIVADLHFEKGSGFAERGRFLPPYDTGATLDRLANAIGQFDPDRVICLGDSFHDARAGRRMAHADRDRLAELTAEREWVWITGNHDPLPDGALSGALCGRVVPHLVLGGLILRHEALGDRHADLSGHYHPKAAVRARAGRVAARCFVENGRRLILPAFGAYTGGLNAASTAIRRVMGGRYRAHLIGRDRLYAFPHTHLIKDPPQPARASA